MSTIIWWWIWMSIWWWVIFLFSHFCFFVFSYPNGMVTRYQNPLIYLHYFWYYKFNKRKKNIFIFSGYTEQSCLKMDDHFWCPIEHRCLPKSVRCNHVQECFDGFDELNCGLYTLSAFFIYNMISIILMHSVILYLKN